ncbi:MAG TPA: D-aminoacylase [Thermomicrobiales bacterium]|nr:D-aminoacylase [Thermomicrobiales bacterium]
MATYDALIRGGRVIDGSGNPWFYGDVAIAGGKVAAIAPAGRIDPASAGEVIDASGHVVCPGFIDIQSHSLIPLFSDPRSLSKITQGVTTEIMGEGWTPAPFGGRIEKPLGGYDRAPEGMVEVIRGWTRFADWIEWLSNRGASVNFGSFLGGGTVREYVKGWEMGDLTPAEIAQTRQIVREAMEDGAFGVATALIYPPNSYTTDAELYAMCEVIAEYGGVYITHMRSEADTFLEELEKTLDLPRQTGCALELYHLKVGGRRNWDKMTRAIAMVNAARAEGLDVTSDMYPYIAGGTGLASSLPNWAAADGKLMDNLRDPVMREKLRHELVEPTGGWEALATLAGPEGVLVTELTAEQNQQYSGKLLSEIADARGQHWADCLMDLVLEDGDHWISAIYFMMSEVNLPLQLQQPWMKVSTDAPGVDPEVARAHGPVHPRSYGTYPRVLGKYVREEGALELEDAVRKMTSAVADRLMLRDRGLLREGMQADVVIFDPATVGDNATFEDPHQHSTGIRDVWVNGGRVLRDGQHTGATPGQAVYGPGRE